jgi:hypothetical protein
MVMSTHQNKIAQTCVATVEPWLYMMRIGQADWHVAGRETTALVS